MPRGLARSAGSTEVSTASRVPVLNGYVLRPGGHILLDGEVVQEIGPWRI